MLAVALPQADRLELADGSTASLEDGALHVRDPHGALLLRFEDGHAEIRAPAGDLTLSAPGRVVLRSGMDVCLEAARDIRHDAARRFSASAGASRPQLEIDGAATRVRGDRLEVDTPSADVKVGRASLIARRISVSASAVAQRVDRYELAANQLVETARDAYRDVSELFQQRVGRMRTIVEDVHSLNSRRNVMLSDDDTRIDGRRILLG